MRKKAIAGLVLLSIAICTVYASLQYRKLVSQPWPNAQNPDVEIWVERGDSYYSVLGQLAQRDLRISEKLYLRVALRNKHLHTGIFRLHKPSFAQLVDRLARSSDTVAVTIVEGDNMFEVANKLEAAKIVRSAQNALEVCQSSEWILSHIGIEADRCEGYLYPETYSFVPYSDPQVVLAAMVEMFATRTHTIFSEHSMHDPRSIDRIVTLASIVEKETGASQERPLIASVFLNRLIRGMRLQSDPTTIYGIWEEFDGNLTRAHLRQNTAYNTYAISALPPTPIANPGIESIQAVLKPANSPYLYFVAKGSAGEHYFSTNYKEHQRAVRRYQLGQ